MSEDSPALRIRKSAGDLSLVLAPSLGGAIASLRFRGVDILRPLDESGEWRANLAGSFPLVPYSNRIAHGRFSVDGRHYGLDRNFGEHPHSIHGNGWQRAWHVESESRDAVAMTLLHDPRQSEKSEWPWAYRARQVFSLTEDTLFAALSCTNLAEHDMPAGLGFHPYFAHANRALLQFAATGVLIHGDDSLPIATQQVPDRWDYRTMRAPVAASVDNCFTGWDRTAKIHWPDSGIEVEIHSPEAEQAVLFIPAVEKNFVAVEPVTNVNNAINDLPIDAHPGGMRRLHPGETLSVSMSIKVSSCTSATAGIR